MVLSIDSVQIINFRQLENFKLDIKPMTILVGPNGSGKSSFLRAMKFLSYNIQAFAKKNIYYKSFADIDGYYEIPQIFYNFDDINFLSFKDVVTNNDESKTIEFTIEGTFFWPQAYAENLEELEYKIENIEKFIKILKKKNFSHIIPEVLISGDEKFFEFTINFSFGKDGYINFSFLDKKNNLKVVYYNQDIRKQGVFLKNKRIIPHIDLRFPDDSYIFRLIEEAPNKNKYKNVINYKKFLSRTFKISELYNRIILGYIFDLDYLSQLRKIPKGLYVLNNGLFPNDVDYDFWNDFLTKEEYVNLDSFIKLKEEWERKYWNGIEFTEEEKEENKKSSKFLPDLLSWESLFSTLEKLGLAKGIFKEIDEKNNIGQIKVVTMNDAIINIENESSGFLQIFPILIYASYVLERNYKKLLIVEQPELHLHPNLQFELAQHLKRLGGRLYFYANYYEIDYYIIETHSEHLIRGVQVEVAKGNLKPEDVAVYYVDKDKKGVSSARLLELDENGNFTTEWPSGFMDLSSRAAYELLNTQLKNKSK